MKWPKRRQNLIKFKSMAEILMTENTYFDHHGNLTCPDSAFGYELKHLSPTYFKRLGKLMNVPAGHGFPTWAIDSEYNDVFHPNMALKKIGSGKYSEEDAKNIAIKELHATKEGQCWDHETSIPPLPKDEWNEDDTVQEQVSNQKA